MKLSEIKSILPSLSSVSFTLPDGTAVAPHFHVTEVGSVNKKYIDCGGTLRDDSSIHFQLWEANDFDHRLSADTLLSIIELSEKKLQLSDLDVEVEYQGRTIEIYALGFNGTSFQLIPKSTDCLAPDKCGVEGGGKSRLQVSCCDSDTGCC